MTKQEKISLGVAIGAAALLWFGKRATGVSGIGAADEYVIIKRTGYPYRNSGAMIWDVEVLCGWDKYGYARFNNPYSQIAFNEKIYKTLKGAESALRRLIDEGEGKNTPGYNEVELEIMNWRDYVNSYIRR